MIFRLDQTQIWTKQVPDPVTGGDVFERKTVKPEAKRKKPLKSKQRIEEPLYRPPPPPPAPKEPNRFERDDVV